MLLPDVRAAGSARDDLSRIRQIEFLCHLSVYTMFHLDLMKQLMHCRVFYGGIYVKYINERTGTLCPSGYMFNSQICLKDFDIWYLVVYFNTGVELLFVILSLHKWNVLWLSGLPE